EIESFNPRNIPMTQAKKDIIRASRSKVDDIVIDHFKLFKEGIVISQVELWKPQEMRTVNGQRKRLYKMKVELISIYENMVDKDVDEKEIEVEAVEQEKQQEGNEYV
ncbi:MAG: hypothetical protein EZS28_033170, partial [Streblomastix strix]